MRIDCICKCIIAHRSDFLEVDIKVEWFVLRMLIPTSGQVQVRTYPAVSHAKVATLISSILPHQYNIPTKPQIFQAAYPHTMRQ